MGRELTGSRNCLGNDRNDYLTIEVWLHDCMYLSEKLIVELKIGEFYHASKKTHKKQQKTDPKEIIHWIRSCKGHPKTCLRFLWGRGDNIFSAF